MKGRCFLRLEGNQDGIARALPKLSCYHSQFYLDFTVLLKNPLKHTFLENIIRKDPFEAPTVLANEPQRREKTFGNLCSETGQEDWKLCGDAVLLSCPVYLLFLFLFHWPAVEKKCLDSCESHLPETFCFGHILVVAMILVPFLSAFPIWVERHQLLCGNITCSHMKSTSLVMSKFFHYSNPGTNANNIRVEPIWWTFAIWEVPESGLNSSQFMGRRWLQSGKKNKVWLLSSLLSVLEAWKTK